MIMDAQMQQILSEWTVILSGGALIGSTLKLKAWDIACFAIGVFMVSAGLKM